MGVQFLKVECYNRDTDPQPLVSETPSVDHEERIFTSAESFESEYEGQHRHSKTGRNETG
jgi:hypothetical protein